MHTIELEEEDDTGEWREVGGVVFDLETHGYKGVFCIYVYIYN